MTPAAIRAWLETLAARNDCGNPKVGWQNDNLAPSCCRRHILKNLLHCANADQMTQDDRVTCQQALTMVEANLVPNLTGPIYLPSAEDLDEVH